MKKNKYDQTIVNDAFKGSITKLNPKEQLKNPIIFVVYLGVIATGIIWLGEFVKGEIAFFGFEFWVFVWLFFTVIFANFAEALAEGRGKAQANALRSGKKSSSANKLLEDGTIEQISSEALKIGDIVVVNAGETIPSDGEVIKGIASIDESAITGESAPVIRESGAIETL